MRMGARNDAASRSKFQDMQNRKGDGMNRFGTYMKKCRTLFIAAAMLLALNGSARAVDFKVS